LKINLFSPWYSWNIAELALNNNQSLNPIELSILWIFWVLSSLYLFNHVSIIIGHGQSLSLVLSLTCKGCNNSEISSRNIPLMRIFEIPTHYKYYKRIKLYIWYTFCITRVWKLTLQIEQLSPLLEILGNPVYGACWSKTCLNR
jgi:hypothetical protein